MLGHMRALYLLCTLLVVLQAANGQGPEVTSSTYKVKTAEVQQASLTILEYDIKFDQDVFSLRGNKCPAFACTPPTASACPPCNYASKTSCGQAPPGCPACPLASALCPSNPADRTWIEIGLDQESDLFNISTGDTVVVRWYLPADKVCNGFDIEILTRSGDPDLAGISQLNVGAGADWWFGLNSGGDVVAVCPSDPNFAAGTFEAQIYGYLAGSTSVRVAMKNVPSVAGVTIPCNLSSHVCLQNDIEELYPLPATTVTQYYYFAYAMTGPCPRLFSFYHQNVETDDFVTVSLSTVHPFPDYHDEAQLADLFIFEDFTTHYVSFSFCPADITKPTIVLDETGALFRVTSSPAQFATTPLNQLGQSDYDMGHYMLQYVMMQTPTKLFMPCDRFYGGFTCAVDERTQGLLAPVPPYNVTNVLNPPWPWLWVTKRSLSVIDSTTVLPPEIPRVFDTGKFAFNLIVQIELVQDGVAQRQIFVDPADYDSLQWRFRAQLVGSNLYSVNNFDQWHNATRQQLTCNDADFFRIRTLIQNTLNELETSGDQATGTLLAKLDVLNFQDAWIACDDATKSYMQPVTATILLDNSTLCTPELTASGDPCCSLDGLWESCCTPRAVNLTVQSYPTLLTNKIEAECPDARQTCVNQFLTDYRSDVASKQNFELGCSGSRLQRDSFFRQSNTFWKVCMDTILGENLQGIPCATDAECVAIGAARCNFNNMTCAYDRDILAKRFLSCFVEKADPFIQVYILKNVLRKNSSSDLVGDIFSALQAQDCLPDINVDRTRSRHYRWASDGCEYLCLDDPLCLYELCTIPPGCMWAGFPSSFCARDPFWSPYEPTEAQCATEEPLCNDLSVREANASCTAGSFCGVCEADGTCWPLPGITSQAACTAAYACASPVAPHTYITTLDNSTCANFSGCTVSCQLAGVTVACTSEAACTAAGTCSDDEWFTSESDPEGACVYPVAAFAFGGDCAATYAIPSSFTSPVGCINVTATESECASLVDGAQWYQKAHTEAACTAHGLGCVQPTPIDAPSALQPEFLSPKSAADCSLCGYTQKPYFDWTPGRWLGSEIRKPVWVSRQLIPVVRWRTGFAYDQLGTILDAAITEKYDVQVRTEQLCRFNRISQSLAGIACSCGNGTSPDKCIDAELSPNLVIGVSEPCGGELTQAVALPFTVTFQRDSVRLGTCTSVRLVAVSKVDYRYVKRVNPSSTFIPAVTRAEFEFANSKRGVVGEFAQDGIRIILDQEKGLPANFSLCVQGVQPVSNRFPIADFALVTDKRKIRPLELTSVTDFTGGERCGVFLSPPASAFTVIPVNRVKNWRSKTYNRFNSGQRALVIFSGVLYTLGFIFCGVIGYFFVIRLRKVPIQSQIVWPIMLLCFVRLLYFFLLASNRLSNERISAGEFFLTDFPLNLYICVMFYLVLYWILVVFSKVKYFFSIIVAAAFSLYVLFFIVLFLMQYLPYDSAPYLSCQFEADPYWTNRRIINVTYKIILALVCIVVGGAFTIFGRQIFGWLRKVETAQKSNNQALSSDAPWWQLSNSVKLLVLAIFSTVSLLATSVFLLVLATINWRSTVLGVLLLWAIELAPLLLLLYLITGQRDSDRSSSAGPSATKSSAEGERTNSFRRQTVEWGSRTLSGTGDL